MNSADFELSSRHHYLEFKLLFFAKASDKNISEKFGNFSFKISKEDFGFEDILYSIVKLVFVTKNYLIISHQFI